MRCAEGPLAAETYDILAREALPGDFAPLPSSPRPATPPSRVMLLDLNWKQTPYLVAALADSGIATTLVSTMRPDRIGLRRFCEQLESPNPRSAAYVPFLRREIARVRPDLLIPLCEPLMEMLWNLDPPLEVPVYPPITEEQRGILMDRRRFYDRAAAAGIAVAPWMPIGARAGLESAARRFGYPFVLRGTRGMGGSQVRIVSTRREAATALEDLASASPGQPFAQQFVQGRRHLVGGYFSQGEAVRLFAQCTLEAHPVPAGPSIRVRACDDAGLIASALTLFADLDWSGIACAEFIRDGSGNFVLMEMNPRPWAALEVAERSGAGICRAFTETLAGRPVAPLHRCRAGESELVLEGYLQARRRSHPGLGSTLRSLKPREWLACLRALPWSRPWLTLHLLRRLYREVT